MLHRPVEIAVGKQIYELGDRQWDIPALRKLLDTILPRDQSFEGYMMDYEFPGIGRRNMMLNARRIVGTGGDAKLILLAMEDVTARG